MKKSVFTEEQITYALRQVVSSAGSSSLYNDGNSEVSSPACHVKLFRG